MSGSLSVVFIDLFPKRTFEAKWPEFFRGMTAVSVTSNWTVDLMGAVFQIWLQSDYDKLCTKILPVMPYTHYFHRLVYGICYGHVSVCLSITSQFSIRTAKLIIMQRMTLDGLETLVF